ncbi:type VI secretion system contractile sheath domain-containing protein [Vibrio sp.]|uniref:type VI secretion system contractile sheath domain-containing protein n=1 Tax=Vibrio sp. TaxID=678 RepID=UPI00311E9DE9
MQLAFNLDWQKKFLEIDSTDSDFLRKALSVLFEIQPDALDNQFSLVDFVAKMISLLDRKLSSQMDKIIHHDEFKSLHSSWLGVHGLVSLPINNQRVKVKVLDMHWHEVSSDVNQAYNIKASNLFNKIGNKELNTLGGQPFGCILFTHPVSVDMDFDADYDDLFTVELLSKLGESTLCPMIFSPNKNFFVESGADWLSDIDRIEKILAGPDFHAWQSLRSKQSCRFIGFAMPLIRMRYQYKNMKVGFIYNELGSGLWGNAGFALMSTIMREYHRVNWFGFLKSRWNDKSQGAVINIDQHDCLFIREPQTNVVLFGKISTFYAQHGFIPLTKSPLTDKYFFNGNNSIWQSGTSDNDKVLTQIQTSLMSCRIAHYLKVQVREMLGSFNTASECERFLTQWIEKFSSNVTYANEETLAKYPLSFAKISVSESDTQAGSFICTLRIVPQYQYDHFTGEVILTTELDEVS